MPEKGEVIDGNYTLSIENLNINDWTKIQMTKTLELLNGKTEDQPSFYSIEGEKVIYNINLVIKYLTHLCKKEDGTLKTWKEMMDDMQIENKKAGLSYGVSTPWIMAVQIALEYLGYDIGKIDGNLGLDTKKMIRKYQKDNNLPIDGQPRPPMISLLIDRINEKLGPKIELDEITKNFIQQGEKLYGEGIFQINQDGSLNVTEKLEFWINKWGNDTNTNDIGPIEKILKNTLKDGKCIAIEINNNGKKNNIIIVKNEGKIICHSIFPIEVLCFDHDYNSSIKIIGDIGIDKYFLINNYENIGKIQSLRDLGITMESSKEILNIIMKEKKIYSYENLILSNNARIDGNLPPNVIEFIFGNINKSYYEKLLPITLEDGLKFYKIKTMLGEEKFKQYIPDVIKLYLSNKGYSGSLDNIIKSNLQSDDIKKYLDLCTYLNNRKCYKFPDLYGYDIDCYSKIIKYMFKYNIPHNNLSENIIKYCDILLKNNISGDVYFFMGGLGNFNNKLLEYFDEDNLIRINKIEDLFNKSKGAVELYQFLSKYPQRLENLGGKKIKKITLNTKKNGYNFCFRGILEMINSRDDIEIPNLKRDGEQKWKKGREIIIKEYESLLRNYISLDKDKDGNEIPSKKSFDKIFFANALDHPDEDHNGAFQGEYNMFDILKNFTEDFENCSSIIDKNGNIDQSNQKMMIEKIKQYANIHQNEKILVCVEYHGRKDGSSGNGWTGEDRVKLANISPNIKIISNRCYFGAAYSNENFDAGNYIYSIQSPVSGFSNNTSGSAAIVNWLRKGYKELLGFHELEIYTRLHYDDSFTPLTEYMDYIDFRTGKKRRGLVGLADAGIGNERDDIA